MSYYGMQLRKLQLEGANKENATINFNSGLNIIAGASDTGPICHTEMKSPISHGEVYFIAIQKEKQKLNAHLIDLQSTINNFETELERANQKILQEEKKVHDFETEII